MNKEKYFNICLLLIALPFLSCSDSEKPSVIPHPAEIAFSKSIFKIPSEATYHIEGFSAEECLHTENYLLDKIKTHFGTALTENSESGDNVTIRLIKAELPAIPSDEGYNLEVTKKEIVIQSPTSNGIFNGINTLIQLIQKENKTAHIQGVKISDYPRFSWRGMHLDVSRHFFSVDEVKRYIDLLALHKMNVFHWHLTDDQGWRIEIKKYPELTRTGAYRIAGNDIPWNYSQELSFDKEKELYGGFYTQDEIREIVGYAADRFITIVPEIEMPGHSQAALTAYPHLSCSGKPYTKNPDVPFEFTHPFCAGNPETFVFLKDVLTEVMELFPSEYIHIGGDEANHKPWESCTKCRKRMKELKLNGTGELQASFIEEIDSFIREKGRHSIGWDEIMEGDLSREAAIMSWRESDLTLLALTSGYKTVSATSEFLYLSTPQDRTDGQPGNTLSIEKVFSFEPANRNATKQESDMLMGINGCIWTENIPDFKTLEYHLLPRLGALASIAWIKPENKSFSVFEKGLISYFSFLDRESAEYCIDSPKGLSDDLFFEEGYTVTISPPYPGTEVRYTLDGTEPQASSGLYKDPLNISETTTLKARSFLPSGKSSPVRTAFIRKVNLRNSTGLTAPVKGLCLNWDYREISSLDSINPISKENFSITDSIKIPLFLQGKDHFVLVFEGFFYAETDGIYRFFISSDDGSRLWLNNELLADNDGVHGKMTIEGNEGLKKGYHPIKIEFFEARYGETLTLEVEEPGSVRKELDSTRIFYEKSE